MEEIDMSCSRTVTVSGFLWNQELRRKMVKEVADVIEARNGLLANALVYPMVRFSLRNGREGRRRMVLNTLRVGSSVEVLLRDSVREVQHEDSEEQIKVSGLLSSPPTSRVFPAVSCTRRPMTCSGRSRLESIYKTLPCLALQLELSPLYCDFLYEE